MTNLGNGLRERILSGQSDANIRFDDLRTFLLRLGFVERVRGSHHTFRKEGIRERLNIQRDGSHAKPYQVRQGQASSPEKQTLGGERCISTKSSSTGATRTGHSWPRFPNFPGCAAHGDTQQTALEEIGQAMDLWLETAREFGDPIPEPKGERLMLA